MVDAKAECVQLSISDCDLEITQSPGILQSTRAGGTTGATVWEASVRLAEWIAWPKNFLHSEVLGRDANALELGSGISGIIPLMLHARVKRVIATDQPYLLKALQDNIRSNLSVFLRQDSRSGRRARKPQASTKTDSPGSIDVLSLDWENDDIPSFLKASGLEDGVELVVACDCVFNYALIDPLVQTCRDICQFRSSCTTRADALQQRPTVCVVCQQLRQPDVFLQWLEAFCTSFRVWRVPDELLTDALKEGSGFVVHVGVLRD